MLKLLFCLHRLPHLSRGEFQRYWRETHGPLVRRHAGVLRIVRYVQSHALGGPLDEALQASRGAASGYDGVAELWWASAEELAAATASAEGRAASLELLADEQRFIDLARSTLFVAAEHEVISP
jgi:uncharacterized protein (TIGR02118 family)